MEKNKINFIGIGAQKAGTTWLHKRLSELPDFSHTPLKELHYFDRSKKYPSIQKLTETYTIKRIINPLWLFKALKQTYLKRNTNEERKWYKKWYFSNYNNDWYLSLFDNLQNIKGEITPSYSMLDIEDIKEMHSIAPDAKIIFLIRNPIERAWSQYRFQHKKKNDKDFEFIINFIDSETQELRSNYKRTIENYLLYYKKEQFKVFFFDEIINTPNNLLHKIVEYLGGNTQNIDKYCNVNLKVNISRKIQIPSEVLQHLKAKYKSDIIYLNQKYGSYAKKWYNDYYM